MNRIRYTSLMVLATLALSTLVVDAVSAAGPTRLRRPRVLPLVIREPGSYILTENFTTSNENQTVIQIEASDVTLDLNGFVIRGPVECTGIPSVCSSSGSGVGISALSHHINTTIRNGTVRGMGSYGIHLEFGTIENVRALSNGADGIVASGCVLRDSLAMLNGGNGFFASACVVTNNVAIANGAAGFLVDASTVSTNAASSNGGDGISSQGTPSGSAAIHDNAVVGNTRSGIAATFVTAVGNLAYDNGNYGITGGSGLGFALNAVTANVLGQTSGGYELANNVCGLDMTCP